MNSIREQLENGMRRHQAGEFGPAEDIYRRVLKEAPQNPDAHHLLGLIAQQHGRTDAAIKLISRAIKIEPDRATFHFNLAAAQLAGGDQGLALQSYQKTAELQDDWAEAHFSHGSILGQMGRPAEAEAALRRAIELQPDYADAWCSLGPVLSALDRLEDAKDASEKAAALNPKLGQAWINLGNALEKLERPDDAFAAFEHALAVDPDLADGAFNLGNLLSSSWQLAEARHRYEVALRIDPAHLGAAQGLLMSLLYDPVESEKSVFDAHAARMAAVFPATANDKSYQNNPDTDRPLKVGFVSPDFRTHSCAYFLEPLFDRLRGHPIEMFAYANLANEDETTSRLRLLTDHWADIRYQSDRQTAKLISDDGIDILIDLAGHSRGARPGVFALTPAPVQISWLGYAATTGLPAMGYRLTDHWADPEGDSDRFHTEKLIRLTDGFHCYRPPALTPDVAPLPAASSGRITFGSFNNPSKINSEVIAVWSDILAAMPAARLLLKGRTLGRPDVADRIRRSFADNGVAPSRIDFYGWIPRGEDPLSLYNDVDIALDTFPYNGTTTSLEALWMGVPVITLAGRRHAGRVGISLLNQVGHPELIATDARNYTGIAMRLGEDLPALLHLRERLRADLAASPLSNEAEFARRFEAGIRRAWRNWCGNTG